MLPDTTPAKYHAPSPMRARNALLARTGLARTFGGLGSFLAVIFLGGGVYLLPESFADPLQAQAVGLIAGAFIIALATILIYFIFSPQKGLQSGQARHLQSTLQRTRRRRLCLSYYPLKEEAKSLAGTIASA